LADTQGSCTSASEKVLTGVQVLYSVLLAIGFNLIYSTGEFRLAAQMLKQMRQRNNAGYRDTECLFDLLYRGTIITAPFLTVQGNDDASQFGAGALNYFDRFPNRRPGSDNVVDDKDFS